VLKYTPIHRHNPSTFPICHPMGPTHCAENGVQEINQVRIIQGFFILPRAGISKMK